ncbi:MAG: lactonase family protein [Actinomycetota bacterium]|nr:lactonase family protein [Actinomycetota bacterium]
MATLTLALLVLLVLIAVAAAAQRDATAAAPTGWLVQPRGEAGCVHARGTNRCARARAVTSPEDVAVSPDGRYVYVASYGSHAVAVFRRDRRTGELEQPAGRRGCVRHERGGSCSSARALASPTSLAISADGANVYVTSAGSDAVSVFARNRQTGALRQLQGASGCVSQRPGGGCLVGRGLNEPTSVAVSPDGQHVYVAGRRFPSGVAVLARAADGSLTQPAGPAGCISHRGGSGCAAARGISAAEEVAVTPDSRHVLVAGMRSNAIAVLSQGPDGLVQAGGEAGCIAKGGAEGCARARALAGPVDLAITADGGNVYAASSISDGVAILRRDGPTGALTQSLSRAGCISQDGSGGRCAVGRGLDEVWGIALTPDGRNLYAVSAKVNMLGAIARNRSTGTLAQLRGRYGCFIRAGGLGCPEGRGLTVAVAVTVSRDGRNVYVASEDAYLGSVAVFRRVGE